MIDDHGADVVSPPEVGTVDPWSDRLRQMLESTGDGIFGVGTDGCCTFINRAGAELIGWPAADVLGRNMHELIHHSHGDGSRYPETDCPIFNAFRNGTGCRVDRDVLWRRDGSPFAAEYSSHPIVDRGAVQGAVVTFVDITERRLAEDLLTQAHADLERRVEVRTAELSSALGRLRDLSAWLETVREGERSRIARDIHDELGSLLVALRLDVNWMERRVQGRGEEGGLVEKCQTMGARIDRAVDAVGRIITDLRPSILDHQGLWAALEWQAAEFVAASDARTDVRMHVEAGVEPPGGETGDRWSIAVFRIFQEMLSNVARHARATSVTLRLYVEQAPGAVLHLRVEDDGIGADPGRLADPRSHGVTGMHERAGHFGGTLSIHGRTGAGTRVALRMPFPEDRRP